MLFYAFNHKQNQHNLEKQIIRFVVTGMKRSASERPTMSGLNPRKLWSSELPGATRHRSRPRFGTGSSLAWRHVILGVLREGRGKGEMATVFLFFSFSCFKKVCEVHRWTNNCFARSKTDQLDTWYDVGLGFHDVCNVIFVLTSSLVVLFDLWYGQCWFCIMCWFHNFRPHDWDLQFYHHFSNAQRLNSDKRNAVQYIDGSDFQNVWESTRSHRLGILSRIYQLNMLFTMVAPYKKSMSYSFSFITGKEHFRNPSTRIFLNVSSRWGSWCGFQRQVLLPWLLFLGCRGLMAVKELKIDPKVTHLWVQNVSCFFGGRGVVWCGIFCFLPNFFGNCITFNC